MDNNYNPLNDNDNENKNSIDENLHTDETQSETSIETSETTQIAESELKPSKKPWLFIALGAIVIVAIVLAIIFSGGSDDENSSDNSDAGKSTSSQSETTSATTVTTNTTSQTTENSTVSTNETTAPSTNESTSVATDKPKEEIKKETKKDTISYETKYKNDNTLEEGKTKVQQEGKNGYKEYEREVTYLNGEVTKTGEWKLVNTVKATNKIVIKGTKKKITKIEYKNPEGSVHNSNPSKETEDRLLSVHEKSLTTMDRVIRVNDERSIEAACDIIWIGAEFIDYGRGELFYEGENSNTLYYSYYEDFSDEFKLKLLQIMEELELKFAAYAGSNYKQILNNFRNSIYEEGDNPYTYYTFIGRAEAFEKGN